MRSIAYILTCLCLWMQPAGAQHAADILSRAASLCRQSGGITALFTLRTHSGQLSESFEGVIHMKGDKFALVTPDMKTWYDGLTQWTYMERIDEVNITTPEGDDLQLTNPAILLASYQNNFAAVYQGEATSTHGKTAYRIELTPTKKTDVSNVEIQIDKSSGLPVRFAIQLRNKARYILQISDIKTHVTLPDSFFTFPHADYPHAEIIDLRP